MASRIAGMDDILSTMEKLAFYMLTVICGLFIHSLVVLPLVFFAVTRKNPYAFMKGLRDALMTAFGIASRFVAKTFFLLGPMSVVMKRRIPNLLSQYNKGGQKKDYKL